ncbi:hypothetical protein AV947_gp07 [Podophage Lau218]|uniref:Putative phage protein n=2 Tax=Lauvirus lau218 TaxID=1465639 RepID=A0A060BQW3_9CAUD|nr:hypothetical protein AV947_gp07 [Podophage Lau218]AIA83122.1 putative phage protein [Podophage Lau218]AIA83170.1 putative phage protein [Lauvirus lau218]AIA83218.1 putative phage protein [Lauvirus lau218]
MKNNKIKEKSVNNWFPQAVGEDGRPLTNEEKSKWWYIVGTFSRNDNTAEFGYGDYPEYIRYVKCKVFAETIRKAQNKAKKENEDIGFFGGRFGMSVYSHEELEGLDREPDIRGILFAMRYK